LSASDTPWPAPPEATGDQVFAAPWQAQAFALTVALHEAGAFTWSEWAQALGAELAKGAQQAPDAYYSAWLAALERLSSERGLASPADLAARKQAWAQAYLRTPHGRPVVL
jgi:nitrile hydratase accessory protein